MRRGREEGKGRAGEARPGAVEGPAEVRAAPEGAAEDESPARAPCEDDGACEGEEDAEADQVGKDKVRDIECGYRAEEDERRGNGCCSWAEEWERGKDGMDGGEVGDGPLDVVFRYRRRGLWCCGIGA